MNRLSLPSLGITRSGLRPRPKTFKPHTVTREQSRAAFRTVKLSSPVTSLAESSKPETSTASANCDPDSSPRDKLPAKERYPYTNKYGEEIIFKISSCPPGFEFLAAGNHYKTRDCRKLADKLYVVTRRPWGRDPGKHLGICIPMHVHDQVEKAWYVFEEKKKKREEQNARREMERWDKRMENEPKLGDFPEFDFETFREEIESTARKNEARRKTKMLKTARCKTGDGKIKSRPKNGGVEMQPKGGS